MVPGVTVRAMAAGDEARAKIQRLLVTGDNRLKQGVAPGEGARELRAGARRGARGRPRGRRAAARRGAARGSRRAYRLKIQPTASQDSLSRTLGKGAPAHGEDAEVPGGGASAPSRSSGRLVRDRLRAGIPGAAGLVSIALGFGLALLAGLYAFGEVSGGHFNPAVSLAMFLDRRLPMDDLIGYWIAQFARRDRRARSSC